MRLYAIVENVHRADLKDVDRENAFYRLYSEVYGKGKEPHAEGDRWPGATDMAKDLGVSRMVVQNVLNAYSVRHDLRVSSNTSTSDLESMASLAKDDPKAAKALLRARAEGKIGGRDLEKAGPTVRAHATPAARAQAVQEILHAKKQADDYMEEVHEEVKGYAKAPKIVVRRATSADVRRLKRVASLFKEVRLYATWSYVGGIEDVPTRERAVHILEDIGEYLQKELVRLRR